MSMDEGLKNRMYQHTRNYKRTLDKIIEKYSKLQDYDGGKEVDLDQISYPTLAKWMSRSKMKLTELESQSRTDLREESFSAQNVTGESQLDFTHQDDGGDQSADSTSQLSIKDSGMTSLDETQLTVSSPDESQKTSSEVDLQPEDEDELLEMSLSSNGTSLVDLYPSMISRLGQACHRLQVSNAADAVLRKYHRWRQQSRTNLDSTFDVSVRANSTRETSPEDQRDKIYRSPVKKLLMGTETPPRSPLQMLHALQHERAQQESCEGRGSSRREQRRPILVMDLSGPVEFSLNKTMNVSELSPSKWSQHVTHSYIHNSPRSLINKTAMSPLKKFKQLSSSAHLNQSAGCSMHVPETTAVRERPQIYNSPVRQSPLKERMVTSRSRSAQMFCQSPDHCDPRSPVRSRSSSPSLSSPLLKPSVPPTKLFPRVVPESLKPRQHSPRTASTEDGGHRRRRHLSFDSSLPPAPSSLSTQQLDEQFKRFFHKFVCQSKSPLFQGTSCSLCCKSSEARRGHSSSMLAALALSPHCSLGRKRHRESGCGHPQSKRLREQSCLYSPRPSQQGREMLRRRLYRAEVELPGGGVSPSSCQHRLVQRGSAQQPPTLRESWRTRHQSGPPSCDGNEAITYSPRGRRW